MNENTPKPVKVLCADGIIRVARINPKHPNDVAVANGWIKVDIFSVSGFVVLVPEFTWETQNNELETLRHYFEPKGKNKDKIKSWDKVLEYQHLLEWEKLNG